MKELFLPLLRRRRIWIAVLAALFVFLLSGALLSRALDLSQEQINRAYDDMDISFRLAPGRTKLSSSFSLNIMQLRDLVRTDWMENFDASVSVRDYVTIREGEDGWAMLPVTLTWSYMPEKDFGPPSEGSYDSPGLYISPGLNEKLFEQGVGGHAVIPVSGDTERKHTLIRAISPGIPDDVIGLSWDTFDKILRDKPWLKTGMTFNNLTFDVKKERNREIKEIAAFVQKTVNTPHEADWNKYVAVYYNENEIKGMMDPLEKRQASAAFFEKLFRTLLPFVVHILEAVAVLFLTNEFGVRRLLGEGAGKVFLSLWLPMGIVLFAGYGLTVLILSLCGFGANIGWGTAGLHLGVSLGLTAALSALLTFLDPLTLLKERNDE
jgi:hypothetical protein